MDQAFRPSFYGIAAAIFLAIRGGGMVNFPVEAIGAAMVGRFRSGLLLQ